MAPRLREARRTSTPFHSALGCRRRRRRRHSQPATSSMDRATEYALRALVRPPTTTKVRPASHPPSSRSSPSSATDSRTRRSPPGSSWAERPSTRTSNTSSPSSASTSATSARRERSVGQLGETGGQTTTGSDSGRSAEAQPNRRRRVLATAPPASTAAPIASTVSPESLDAVVRDGRPTTAPKPAAGQPAVSPWWRAADRRSPEPTESRASKSVDAEARGELTAPGQCPHHFGPEALAGRDDDEDTKGLRTSVSLATATMPMASADRDCGS